MISGLSSKVNSHFKTVLYTGLFSLALKSTSQAARVSVNNWQHCGKTVDIKTHLNNFNNNYLSATSDLGKLSVRTGKDGTTKFTIQCFTGDNKIALKTSRNRYVVAVGDAIKADRTRVGNWEKFEVHTGNSSGRFAFKSSHGKYMVAEPNRTVLADRTKIGSYESFILESGGSSTGGGGTTPPSSGSSNLQVRINGEWQAVCCEGGTLKVSNQSCSWKESSRYLTEGGIKLNCPEIKDRQGSAWSKYTDLYPKTCNCTTGGEAMHGVNLPDVSGAEVKNSLKLSNGAPIFPNNGRERCVKVQSNGQLKTERSSVRGEKWSNSSGWPDKSCPHFRLINFY